MIFIYLGITLTLEELLKNAGVNNINSHIVARMRKRFGNMVIQAVNEQNATVAKEAYDLTLNLPQTETTHQLSFEGYELDGAWNYCDNITNCFHDTVPCLLKYLVSKETERVKSFQNAVGDYKHSSFTSFVLKTFNEKVYMIMPHYVSSLELINKISINGGVKLMTQMLSAIDFIHSKGFNHMDIKPSNICVNEQGDFILVDLGSIVRRNEYSESTTVYVPPDFQPRKPSNPMSNKYHADNFIDFWMLGMTIAEKALEVNIGGIKPSPKCEELLNILSQHGEFQPLIERLANYNQK